MALRRTLQSRSRRRSPTTCWRCWPIWAIHNPASACSAVPGAGTRVPVWILGSSTFGAQVAAALGLPFAFASHFAPAMLVEASDIYRERFTPSA